MWNNLKVKLIVLDFGYWHFKCVVKSRWLDSKIEINLVFG